MQTNIKAQVSHINSYFDFIYILTIERAKDRQEKIKTNLKGLNFTFFYGVDKKDLKLETLEKDNIYSTKLDKMQNRYSKPMNLGYIACSLGHKYIYEDMVKNDYNRILILEDDVVFNNDGINLFEQIISELPEDWELLYLDYTKNENVSSLSYLKIYTYHLQKMLGGLKWSHVMIKNIFPKKYSKNLRKSGYHYLTSAYAITQSAAQKLIKLQTPIQFPPDHVLAYAITNELINGLICSNKIFKQENLSGNEEIRSYINQ